MDLRSAKSFTSFSVDDMGKAKKFYGKTLGLEVHETPMGLELHLGGGGPPVFIYPSDDYHPPEHTVLNFVVNDIDEAVDDLVLRGVFMESYDEKDIKTDTKGIMRSNPGDQGPKAIAWFKDPAGHILSLIAN